RAWPAARRPGRRSARLPGVPRRVRRPVPARAMAGAPRAGVPGDRPVSRVPGRGVPRNDADRADRQAPRFDRIHGASFRPGLCGRRGLDRVSAVARGRVELAAAHAAGVAHAARRQPARRGARLARDPGDGTSQVRLGLVVLPPADRRRADAGGALSARARPPRPGIRHAGAGAEVGRDRSRRPADLVERHAGVPVLYFGAHHRSAGAGKGRARALCATRAARALAFRGGSPAGAAPARHRLVCGDRLERAVVGPGAARDALPGTQRRHLRGAGALSMEPGRRAVPSFWQPDWLVLREMARVLRGLLADPALGLRDASVLDFGCGTRPYEAWFAAAGARYRGADIDGANEVRIRDDGTLDCADGEYDLVASFQVLEHVWDLDAYLGEARRALRPEGWLLLSTHGSWLYHPHPHDYRRWTAAGLQREVESRGFRLVRMEPVVGPLAWTTIF